MPCTLFCTLFFSLRRKAGRPRCEWREGPRHCLPLRARALRVAVGSATPPIVPALCRCRSRGRTLALQVRPSPKVWVPPHREATLCAPAAISLWGVTKGAGIWFYCYSPLWVKLWMFSCPLLFILNSFVVIFHSKKVCQCIYQSYILLPLNFEFPSRKASLTSRLKRSSPSLSPHTPCVHFYRRSSWRNRPVPQGGSQVPHTTKNTSTFPRDSGDAACNTHSVCSCNWVYLRISIFFYWSVDLCPSINTVLITEALSYF